MVDVREFHPDDADRLVLQDGQVAEAGDAWRDVLKAAPMAGPCWTAEADGRVLGVGGFALRWAGNALAWAYVARDIPRTAWTALTRAVRQRIDGLAARGVWRVDIEVRWLWPEGERWARMLGFEFEAVALRYAPDGGHMGRWRRFVA
ncbi:hypothetical protein UFOVP747_19 [uncultured Caudovirales phage]|uniref:N-acetyltransferase domain-containing protein n=1 Tax=uncultured Caudovirales phage TaxID=2100421 RepID=A0A6J7XC80_9CAUD|nr:hypothetical protein UFOVP675_11 [uncultured Caudovirales phage]CAB5225372.1 hypothetical protein UFOVP747_19 [uncultured Caudovirales phage]